jgi:hypothetical protein
MNRTGIVTASLALLLCACNPNAIQGTVYDIKGEALPGVVVQVEGASYQDLTDARGEYSVAFDEGPVVLDFAKTGYTPGKLRIDEPGGRRVQAAPVTLWNLPQAKGVYLYENYRYRSLMTLEPDSYAAQGLGRIHGTTQWCNELTRDSLPTILAFKLPSAGAALCSMNLVDIELAEQQGQSGRLEVWTRAANLPINVTPIDEPEGLLLQIRPLEPLPPGTYAVHWGALDGVGQVDPRMFLFTVESSASGGDEVVVVPREGESGNGEGGAE